MTELERLRAENREMLEALTSLDRGSSHELHPPAERIKWLGHIIDRLTDEVVALRKRCAIADAITLHNGSVGDRVRFGIEQAIAGHRIVLVVVEQRSRS